MGYGTAEAGQQGWSEQPVRVRDTRRQNWFWVENVLIDVFQKLLGPLVVPVYNVLCREAGSNRKLSPHEAELTLRAIGKDAGVSHETVRQLLQRMQFLQMVRAKRSRLRACVVYELLDLQDAAAPGLATLRARLDAHFGTRKAPPRVDVERMEEGGLLFDFSERAEAVEAPNPVNQVDTEGEEPAEIPVNQVDRTTRPVDGTTRPVDGSVNLAGPLTILEEDKTKTKTTLLNPPASGRTFEEEFPESEESWQAASAMHGATPAPLATVIDGLRRLQPRQGDVSDLREQVTAHMRAAGFEVQADARTADRGDGRAGFLDLWCVRYRGAEYVSIECDAMTVRQRSIDKLRRLGTRMHGVILHRVILLRTATVAPSIEGIDTVIAMGWPGNGAAERAETALARTRVGMAPEPIGVPKYSITSWNVRMVFAEVRAQLEDMGVDTVLFAWDAAFGGVAYERHEMHEGRDAGFLLVVSSPDPPATVRGLGVYETRISRAMAAAFGAPVQVQVVGGRDLYAGGEDGVRD